MKKTALILSVTVLSLAAAGFAFDWPQKETASDSFFSYFGQLRGGTISSSLVFKDNSEIKSADEGKLLGIIKEHDNDFGWFESTLGNAVFVSHENSLVTVYANLDGASIADNLDLQIHSGTYLGNSGNSGWQNGQSCLEFQVIDVKEQSAVNPRILMPKVGKELPLTAGTLTLVDSKNNSYNPASNKFLEAGVYRVYRERQETAVPEKTILQINGSTVERIDLSELSSVSGKMCIKGNRNYTLEEFYPDSKKALAGEIQLVHGKTALSITLIDRNNSAKTVTYELTVN